MVTPCLLAGGQEVRWTSSGAVPLTIRDSGILSQVLEITFVLRYCQPNLASILQEYHSIHRVFIDCKGACIATGSATLNLFHMEGVSASDPGQSFLDDPLR